MVHVTGLQTWQNYSLLIYTANSVATEQVAIIAQEPTYL